MAEVGTPEIPPPTPQPPAASPESPPTTVVQVIQQAEAEGATPREVLRAVAETKTEQPKSEQEKTNVFLGEVSKLLLELKDARITITALAKQATDTPAGNEFRNQTIALLQQMDAESFSKDQKITKGQLNRLRDLKLTIQDTHPLPQPEIKPQETELYRFLKNQPASEQTGALLQALEQGASNPTVVNETLKNPQFQDAAGALKKELFGASPLPQTAEDLLKAAGLSVDQKNVKQMQGILNPKNKLTAKDIGGGLLMTLMITMMASQIIGPLLQENEGGNR